MSIIKIAKKNKDYVVIANAPLNDSRLSFGARGILAYLLTKPEGWQVWSRDLYKQSPAGRKAIDRMLDELKQYGYLRRQRVQDEHGLWSWASDVYEDPSQNPDYEASEENNRTSKREQSVKGSTERPKTDNRKNRQSEKPTIGKTDNRLKGDIESTEPAITEIVTTEAAAATERENTPPAAAAAAKEIYFSVTKIRDPEKVPEVVIDWLKEQQQYMNTPHCPEALRAAIKTADKEGKRDGEKYIFDPGYLEVQFYEHYQALKQSGQNGQQNGHIPARPPQFKTDEQWQGYLKLEAEERTLKDAFEACKRH